MPLVQAGMGVIRSGPSTAEKFGEDSLKLGFSSPLESLLLHLYISNRSEGEKLFSHILAVAKSRMDYNLFSMIGNQVLMDHSRPTNTNVNWSAHLPARFSKWNGVEQRRRVLQSVATPATVAG